jgi:hypothetical protein
VSKDEFEKATRRTFVSYGSGEEHQRQWNLGAVDIIFSTKTDGRDVIVFTEGKLDHLFHDRDSASVPDEEGPATPEEASERVATFEERVAKYMVGSYSTKGGRTGKMMFYGSGDAEPISPKAEELVPDRRIDMPPGYGMEQVARWVFFFSPKTFRRISEEIIADYRHELVEAEGQGKSEAELRTLKIQHWGGFVLSIISELYCGILGKLVKVFTGS